MDKIIPDDIVEFDSNTVISFDGCNNSFFIYSTFKSEDNITYEIVIEHRKDTSIMFFKESDRKWKYYFSPYITQKYIKLVMGEYVKTNPNINFKYEVISLINKIRQRYLSCEECANGESE